MAKARDISLTIAIYLWATILGGIVYSHIVFFPAYLAALPSSASHVTGPYAMHDEHFWLFIHPLMIITLAVTLILNWRVRERRNLIAISAAIYVAAIISTILYFVPELQAFRASPTSTVSAAEWFARGQRWQHLSWTRGAFMFAGLLPLLLALRRASIAAR